MAEEKKEEVLEEVLEDLEAEDAKKQEEAQNTRCMTWEPAQS